MSTPQTSAAPRPTEPAVASGVSSMTGFARVEGATAGHGWAWEARSVNGKGLDVRCRLPGGYEALEPLARQAIQAVMVRGNIQVALSVDEPAGQERLAVDRALLDQVLALAKELETKGAAPPRLDALLSVRGVIAPVEQSDPDARQAAIAAIGQALPGLAERLAAARLDEGAHIARTLASHIDTLAELTGQARATEAARPEALRQRLRALLDTLTAESPPVSEERLAQELALQVGKLDVREELERLDAHVAQARALIAEGRAVGRRLDFLAQELNREANTLCSKSSDTALTQIGMAMKVAIDQLREQVQNVE